MRPNTEGYYLFVVDTLEYAGNFERELTAFCTGIVGECEVGEKQALEFQKDHPEMVPVMMNLVGRIPDEHGVMRPATIWPTPGYWNDGLGNEWKDEDWGKPETIEAYQASLAKTSLNPAEHTGPGRHPAYRSVAMVLNEQPDDDVLGFLVGRVIAWRMTNHDLRVIGYRLIQEVRTEKVLWSLPKETTP